MNKVQKLIDFIRQFIKELSGQHIQAYSSYAALFIIMAFVPFIILLLTMVKHTPLTYEIVVLFINQFLPKTMLSTISGIISEVYRKTGATIISISAITALWSASKGAMALTIGLNNMYHVKEHRNYIMLRLTSGIYTMLLLILIVATLLLMVFGNHIRDSINVLAPFVGNVISVILSFRSFLSTCVLTLFFAALYRFLPDRNASYRQQLPGAFFSALGWFIFSYLFSIYIDSFSNFSNMYGNLAAVILTMIWLYFCMYIFFIGGAINAKLEEHGINKQINTIEKSGL